MFTVAVERSFGGPTTTDLLRGWAVLQGVVPLFALMGVSRVEGAAIAAVVLVAHGLAVIRMPREPASWAFVVALGTGWVACWLPSIGELRDTPWMAAAVVSMWPAALAVLLVCLGVEAADARPGARRLPLVEHVAAALFLVSLFPPWWGRGPGLLDAWGPLGFAFVGTPPEGAHAQGIGIDARGLLRVWVGAVVPAIALSLWSHRAGARRSRLVRSRPR